MKLSILFLTLLLVLPVAPALASEIDIDIDIDDDAIVGVDITGGDMLADVDLTGENMTISVSINGVDLVSEYWKEWKAHKDLLEAYKVSLVYGYYQNECMTRIHEIEDEQDALIAQLNAVLGQMATQIGFAYHIMGVDHNSSEILLSLRSGEVSIAQYLETYATQLQTLQGDIQELEELAIETDLDLSEVQAAASRLGSALNLAGHEINDMMVELNILTSSTEARLAAHDAEIENVYGYLTDHEGRFQMTWMFMGGVGVIVVVLAWTTAGAVAMLEREHKSEIGQLLSRIESLEPEEPKPEEE